MAMRIDGILFQGFLTRRHEDVGFAGRASGIRLDGV
jgi:hypothetical protein